MRERCNSAARVANIVLYWLFVGCFLMKYIFWDLGGLKVFTIDLIIALRSKITCNRHRIWDFTEHIFSCHKNNNTAYLFAVKILSTSVRIGCPNAVRNAWGKKKILMVYLSKHCVLSKTGNWKQKKKHVRDHFHHGDKRQDESFYKCHDKLPT